MPLISKEERLSEEEICVLNFSPKGFWGLYSSPLIIDPKVIFAVGG